ncbi:MAG: hypothetical protein M1837_000353 [Sclerophora amabilis]|nr:MAG: hypothetical protein M1837_000353 [Sclerophora amabilis]
MSGQSPRLIDLLLPGTDLNNPPHYLDYQSKQSEPLYQPMAQSTPRVDILESEDEEVEEIDRQPELDPEAWIMRLPSPSLSNSSSSSTTSSQDPVNVLYRQVDFPAASPEMLMLRFDKQTCGILSVKDGPTENPWRTLIWPLARESPALYHAIASMTAFHTSKEKPSLRVEGMDHMRQSIHALASSINNMATETALATTLVLAFSESWDVHISTGIEHLRGAKILVNQALVQHRSTFNSRESVARLKFLVNTWVYMDVIARLTSVDNDESNDFDHAVASDGPFGEIAEVDPLMGCATSLFPLIGRVANLVRRVRRSETNSPAIISQATDLKAQIESWEVGSNFDPPEDPTSEIKHSMQTAEAYRWATLLYLHQAVPEIPSPSAAILAKNVLKYLATVPLSSRTVIIHIYPLLAAGCEVVGQEDREWVRDRWAAMISRMWIGNIDRCWEVVKEVWGRRDQFAREQAVPARPYGHSGGLSRESSVDMSYANGSTERDFHAEDQANDDSYGWAEMSSEIAGGGERRAPGSNACLSRPTQGNMHHRKSSAENITEDLDLEMTVRGRLHWVGVMKDWNWESKSLPSC